MQYIMIQVHDGTEPLTAWPEIKKRMMKEPGAPSLLQGHSQSLKVSHQAFPHPNSSMLGTSPLRLDEAFNRVLVLPLPPS